MPLARTAKLDGIADVAWVETIEPIAV